MIDCISIIKQLKFTINGVKIPVPLKQGYFLSGNWNLADSLNGILKLYVVLIQIQQMICLLKTRLNFYILQHRSIALQGKVII